MNPNLKRHSTAGFTLIELMLVVTIISLLVSIAIPRFTLIVERATQAKAKSNLGTLRTGISIYYSELEGVFPLSGYPLGPGASLTAVLVPRWLDKVPMPLLKDRVGSFNLLDPANWDEYVTAAMAQNPPEDVYISLGPPVPPIGFPAPYIYDNQTGFAYIPNSNFAMSGNYYFFEW